MFAVVSRFPFRFEIDFRFKLIFLGICVYKTQYLIIQFEGSGPQLCKIGTHRFEILRVSLGFEVDNQVERVKRIHQEKEEDVADISHSNLDYGVVKDIICIVYYV